VVKVFAILLFKYHNYDIGVALMLNYNTTFCGDLRECHMTCHVLDMLRSTPSSGSAIWLITCRFGS